VKLAQAQRLLKALELLQRQQVEKQENKNGLCPVILCGDFNMMPHSALYEFFSRGQLNLSGLSRYFLSGQHFEPKSVVKKRMFHKEQDFLRHHAHGTAPGRFDTIQAIRDDFRNFPLGTIASHEVGIQDMSILDKV
jgi:endonuclease/exonuclease/phosphatase family metal-dependent hydrolase